MLTPTSDLEIRAATPVEIAAYHDDLAKHVIEADVAIVGNRIVGMGGFCELDGRHWVVLNVEPEARLYGVRIVRSLLRKLHTVERTVFIQCDGGRAERLVRLLGFVPTDEFITDMRTETTQLRIWKWPN